MDAAALHAATPCQELSPSPSTLSLFWGVHDKCTLRTQDRSCRFLLPVPTRSRICGPLYQRRIEAVMRHAAGTGQVFHL